MKETINEKSVHDILEGYFFENRWNEKRIKEFYKWLKDFYGRDDERSTRNEMKKTIVKTKASKAKKRNRNFAICAAVIYGIPREIFDGDDKYLPPKVMKTSCVDFLHMEDFDNFSKNLEIYAQKNVQWIENASSVFIQDYLGKGSLYAPGTHLKEYLKIHQEEIFACFRERLKHNKKFTYCRILSLPLRINVEKIVRRAKKRKKKKRDKKREKDLRDLHWYTAIQALKICSFELFEHMCECLYISSDREIPPRFVVAPVTARTQQFSIIDNMYLYREEYRFTKQGNGSVNYMKVNDKTANSNIKKIFSDYQKDINNLSSGDKYRITKDKIGEILKGVIREIIEELSSMEERQVQVLTELTNKKIEAFNKIIKPAEPLNLIN